MTPLEYAQGRLLHELIQVGIFFGVLGLVAVVVVVLSILEDKK